MKLDFDIQIKFLHKGDSNHCFFDVTIGDYVKTLSDIIKLVGESEHFNGNIRFRDKTIHIATIRTEEEVQREAEMDSMSTPLP